MCDCAQVHQGYLDPKLLRYTFDGVVCFVLRWHREGDKEG